MEWCAQGPARQPSASWASTKPGTHPQQPRLVWCAASLAVVLGSVAALRSWSLLAPLCSPCCARCAVGVLFPLPPFWLCRPFPLAWSPSDGCSAMVLVACGAAACAHPCLMGPVLRTPLLPAWWRFAALRAGCKPHGPSRGSAPGGRVVLPPWRPTAV